MPILGGRDITKTDAIGVSGDNKTARLNIELGAQIDGSPLADWLCTIHLSTPSGDMHEQELAIVLMPPRAHVTFVLEQGLIQSGTYEYTLHFLHKTDGRIFETRPASFSIAEGIDASGAVIEAAQPNVIDQLLAQGADHESRINTLETTGGGGTGGVSQSYVDTQDVSTLAAAKAYADTKQPAGAYLTAETDPTVPAWAKTAQKPVYTASEVGADASGTAASSVSAHNQSSDAHADIRSALATKQPAGEYLTSESDPTVPAWAKQANKPSYTAAEVGAEASGEVSSHNSSGTAHSDIRTALSAKADLVDGTVPANQLPSYVDDVLEYANLAAFPTTGVSGKIYVALDTNLTYRWGGSAYVEISQSLALGETSATAYRGDRGKTAYDHSQTAHAPATAEQNVQSDWNVSDNTSDAYIANKPNLASVATSGSYADLSNKPTIVTVWSGTQAQFDAMTEAQKNANTLNAVIG